MKMKSYIIFTGTLIISFVLLASCNDSFFEPDDDNHHGEDRLFDDRNFAEGLLLNAYTAFSNNYSLEEVATDDAVTNEDENDYRRMAMGEWSSVFNPLSVWSSAYRPIYYLN